VLLKSPIDPATASAHTHHHTHTLYRATMPLQPLYAYFWVYVPEYTFPKTNLEVTRKHFNIKPTLPLHPHFKTFTFPSPSVAADETVKPTSENLTNSIYVRNSVHNQNTAGNKNAPRRFQTHSFYAVQPHDGHRRTGHCNTHCTIWNVKLPRN
jgi:hypothetical protein